MNKKAKLNTIVERAIHKHVSNINEGTRDFVILYLRRNNIEVDRESLTKILDVVQVAIEGQHMEKLDILMKDLDSALNEFVD